MANIPAFSGSERGQGTAFMSGHQYALGLNVAALLLIDRIPLYKMSIFKMIIAPSSDFIRSSVSL